MLLMFSVSIIGFLVVFILYADHASKQTDKIRAELHSAVNELRMEQARNAAAIHADCLRSNASRLKANQELRRPLKEMLVYVADLVSQSPQATARTQAVEARFRGFATRVTLPEPTDCSRVGA